MSSSQQIRDSYLLLAPFVLIPSVMVSNNFTLGIVLTIASYALFWIPYYQKLKNNKNLFNYILAWSGLCFIFGVFNHYKYLEDSLITLLFFVSIVFFVSKIYKESEKLNE